MIDTPELISDDVENQTLTTQSIAIETALKNDTDLERLTETIRPAVLDFARSHGAKPWLEDSLQRTMYLDGIVAAMRHVEGGQQFALDQLQNLKPDLQWYRGGTRTTWQQSISPDAAKYFTPEQLNTHVIDGGANGVLGKAGLALGFLKLTPRPYPVLYSLTLADLQRGLETKAIRIGSEHSYDLCINEGDRVRYLEFCRNNLKIQPVAV